ncbi:MAG: DUF5916 domain-containing protein [Aridibacter sp.]
MSKLKIHSIILFLFLICTINLSAQNVDQNSDEAFSIPPEKASPVTVPKFETAPTIDGRIDEEMWKNAAQFKNFVQTNPGNNIAPSKETIAYMGYDEENLYIAFMCFDEPDKIRATVAKRDSVGGEDYVGVFLDTFNDQRRAYILQFNSLGIQADGIRTAQGGSDFSVDIVMESKGVMLENGWSVEVKIPFKSLRYEAGREKLWGVDFLRRIDRFNRETDNWIPKERGVSDLQQLGKITGLSDIKTERTLEITPSITLSQNGERIDDPNVPLSFSRFINRPIGNDIGVSIKYQITPNVTLDAAINPDFAEVEADAPVVRANQRFPIFFPEKRPFFLEGIDIFRSPLQIVNTRNIANPDLALKLTGKKGKNTFGILGAIDDFPDRDFKAYAGVLRLKRDVGENSNIGLFATQYHFGSKRHNHLLGFDGKYQINPRTVFDFQVVGTHSRRFFYNPDMNRSEYRTGNGFAYRLTYDYTGRNLGYFIGLNGRSKDYRADVGFTRRTDTHGASFGYRLQTEPQPENRLIRTTLRGSADFSMDGRGRLQYAGTNARLSFDFQDQFGIDFNGGFGKEKIYEDEFGARRNAFQRGAFFGEPQRETLQFFGGGGVEKTFSKRISVEVGIGFTANDLDLDFGSSERFLRVSQAFLDFSLVFPFDPNLNAPPIDPGKGLSFDYEFNVNLQPTDPLNIRVSYERTKLTRFDTNLTAFDANVFSLRSTYQFTRFIFARARWDYETVEGTLNGQMLFGWNPSPGTAFYIGYNDNSFYRGYNNFINDFDTGFRRDGRSFFIRASYLFRKSF